MSNHHFKFISASVALIAAFICALLIATPARAQDNANIWLPMVRQDGASARVTSPDGAISLHVYLSNVRTGTGAPRFDVTYQVAEGESTTTAQVIDGGALGLDLKDITNAEGSAEPLAALIGASTNWRWLGASARSVRTAYAMPIGERATIPDAYTELTVELQSLGGAPVRLQIIARAYNEGIALRYRLPQQENVTTARIDAEFTAFAFAQNHNVWAQASTGGHPHENEHLPATLATSPSPLENPVTLNAGGKYFMALTEAAVENYPAARFARSSSSPPTLRVDMRGSATGPLPFASPWRVLNIAPSAAKLIEQNYLIYNLAPPTRVSDTSWLKPGKAMRVMNVQSTAFAKSVVDFAQARGMEYIEFDAGWYGPENNPAYSPRDPLPGLDVREVAAYARSKGIGVVLYINFVQLQREVDSLMTLYSQDWGISGLKLGFVDGLTQAGIKEVLYTVQKAAQYRMFVDIHDNYCPSGMNRTWPNLFTQECVRGNEHYPGSEHNATLPFTRLLLGPADYTIAWYTDLKNVTRAHQMALSVIYFSPLKFLFWYDVPSNYGGESEVDFFKHLPSRWDETRVLVDDVGNAVSIARRNGDAWFIGSITDGTARTLELSLDFLPAGETWTAHIYNDGGGTVVNSSQSSVTNGDVLSIELPATGGNAIWLEPN